MYTKYKRSRILSSIFLGPQTPTLKRPEAVLWHTRYICSILLYVREKIVRKIGEGK